ncbi:MAG TPA: sulfotransferase [Janthinobacterium sp.]|jgi:hypothetical protein|nr:sulfotransferase [Janthinobacterium sp.]
MANNILVVAGMHRSGTSLITHWLHDCGLQVGERLLEAGNGNVEGHFEDLEFLRIHEEILKDKGADSTGLQLSHDIAPTRYEKAKMKAIISVKNATYAQWGWKEPRTCLFLGTYAELLPDAKYLVVFRDYKSIVSSLIKRDFTDIEERHQAKGWLYRTLWTRLCRPVRLRRHSARHSERYLRAWVIYNRMILKTLGGLPENRYLVVSYKLMKNQGSDVFGFLSSHWSFRLRYKNFSRIFKNELISKGDEYVPHLENEALLDEANQLSARLTAYLQRSAERLDSAEFSPAQLRGVPADRLVSA